MWQQSKKYKNLYRIPSARLRGYDYGTNGCYYVTICTKNREHYFGEIMQTANNVQTQVETRLIASLQPTPIGEIAEKYWMEIPQHFPFVVLDEFVIMPNHIHGILFFNKDENDMKIDEQYEMRNGAQCGAQCRDAINRVSTRGGITGNHNPMLHQNLGRILRWFKGRVSFECGKIDAIFAWQERFYDSIIRDNNGLENVRQYIFNNPMNWNNDELNENAHP